MLLWRNISLSACLFSFSFCIHVCKLMRGEKRSAMSGNQRCGISIPCIEVLSRYVHRPCACRQRWSWECSSRTSMFTTAWETLPWRTNQWPWCTSPSVWRTESRTSFTGRSNSRTAVSHTKDFFSPLRSLSLVVCAQDFLWSHDFCSCAFH